MDIKLIINKSRLFAWEAPQSYNFIEKHSKVWIETTVMLSNTLLKQLGFLIMMYFLKFVQNSFMPQKFIQHKKRSNTLDF